MISPLEERLKTRNMDHVDVSAREVVGLEAQLVHVVSAGGRSGGLLERFVIEGSAMGARCDERSESNLYFRN